MRYDSARSMIWQAYSTSRDSVMAVAMTRYRIGADIQQTVVASQDKRITHGLEAGQVMSRVEALSHHLRALMLVSFAPMTHEELFIHKACVVSHLHRAITGNGMPVPGVRGERMTTEVAMNLHAVCHAALFHHVETTWPYSRSGLTSPQQIRDWIRTNVSVDLDTRRWSRSADSGACWGRVWIALLDILNEWERAGLKPVASLLRSIRQT